MKEKECETIKVNVFAKEGPSLGDALQLSVSGVCTVETPSGWDLAQLAGAAALRGRIRSKISLMFSLLTRPASAELCRLPH